MTSSYNDVYSRFMNKIRDYEFANLDEPNMTAQMLDWLRSAISHPYIYRIFASFSADDELATMEYVLINSADEYADKNFVEELLGNALVLEWVTPKVQTTTLINQMVTNSKEQRFFSQQQHLAQLRELKADTEHKIRSMLRDKGYIYNSYLSNK